MKNSRRRWSADDDAVLERLYPEHGAEAVAEVLGRSEKAVSLRASARGIRFNNHAGWRRWSDDDDAVLERLYPEQGPAAVAKALGRSAKAVRARARALGIVRSGDQRRAEFRPRRQPAPPPSNPALRGWGYA